ncbi:MAG: hypothetical protein WBP12_05930 [Candidatus Saccharimonas sp.]
MTEIDFDELDKAVTSLMGDVNKPSKQDAGVGVPSSSSALVSGSGSPAVLGIAKGVDSKSAAPSLAAKRRGQFMDIVRPAGPKPSPLPAHRQGVTVAPTSDFVSKPVVTPAPVEDPVQTITPVAPDVIDTTPQPSVALETSEEPTTAEFTNSGPKEHTDTQSNPVAESFVIEKEPASSGEAEVSPLESPFLPDAKPDKRPLGALAPEDTVLNEQVAEIETDIDVGTVPTLPNAPLPAELHDSVVTIESEMTGQDPSSPETETVLQTESETLKSEQPVEVPAGGAIPQQYKEEPSSGEQANGSIYDTANYHKAIEAHTTGGKHGSVLKYIIWGVLLLIAGAGVGATLFMFTR